MRWQQSTGGYQWSLDDNEPHCCTYEGPYGWVAKVWGKIVSNKLESREVAREACKAEIKRLDVQEGVRHLLEKHSVEDVLAALTEEAA